MLKNSFCHIPGIGARSEQVLWNRGILSWDDITNAGSVELPRKNHHLLKTCVLESIERLEQRDAGYFAASLPSHQQWRLFQEFRDSIVYLDIETTGMAPPHNAITTIATYDGESVCYYVRGYNLNQFKYDIARYKLVVTYNGRCFDVPFIENSFGMKMPQAHIDLRFVLKSLGFTGGLKGCEKRMGIDREELDGVDGFFAVLLWHDYERNKNPRALETLLAYNILDAANLEKLMVMAYNLKLRDTPFSDTHQLPVPGPVENLFEADIATVKRLMDLRNAHYY